VAGTAGEEALIQMSSNHSLAVCRLIFMKLERTALSHGDDYITIVILILIFLIYLRLYYECISEVLRVSFWLRHALPVPSSGAIDLTGSRKD
jgi:hypothetical protein